MLRGIDRTRSRRDGDTGPIIHQVSTYKIQEPAYKNPRLALWSASKNGLGWLGLTLARASKNIQASLGWRKNRQCW